MIKNINGCPKQKSLQDEQNNAKLLLGEGRQRLDNALKKDNIIDAQAASALIGAGDEKVKLISEELIKVTDELLIIRSKRKKISFLMHNQPKTKGKR